MATISNVSQFSPRQVSGCVGWFDGKDPLGTGVTPAANASVSTWVDKSGQANNAITVGSNPTYNSNGYIFFNGSNTLKFTSPDALVANTTFSIFVVEQRGNPPSPSNFTYWLGGSSGSANTNLQFGYRLPNQVTLGFFANDYNLTVASPTSNEPFRQWGGIWDGTSKNISLNGTVASSAATGNLTSWSNGSIGYYAPTLNFYTGNIAEIIFFKPAINNSNRQQVEGYLAWKWGLQTSLPTTHPFYTNPFITNLPITPIANPFAERTNYSLNPSQIAGCALWLDAADANSVVLSGSNVSQWNDKSGNGSNATQVTAGNRPTYINNGVSFTASSSNSMSINIPYSISHSIFLVARSTTGKDNYYYGRVGGGAAPTIIQHYVGTSIEYFDGTDRATFVTSPPTNSPFMVNFVRSYGNTVTGFYMGSNAFSIPQTWTFDQINPWVHIGRSDNNTNYLNATICEFMIFRAALTTTQRQQVEGYLAWKWGLRSSLPSTHPNAFMPP